MPQGIGETFEPAAILAVVAVATPAVVMTLVLAAQQRGDHQRQHQQGGVDDRTGQCGTDIASGDEDRHQ